MTRAATSGAGAALPTTARGLLSDRGFFFLWTVGGLTGVVRWLLLLVMGLYTFEITGSPLLVSIVPMLFMLPLALCGPLVGAMADRVDRKIVYLAALVMALVQCIVLAAAAAIGDLGFVHIAIASVLSGLLWSVDFPVRRRWLGDLSRDAIAAAMSLDSATGNATRMLGPLIGGVMLQLFSLSGVFVLSALVFALCLVLVAMTASPIAAGNAPGSQLLRELAAGVRFVLGEPRLRRILAFTVAFNIWGFPFTSMIPVIGSERLSLQPVMIGLLGSAEGFGALIGAIGLSLVVRPAAYLPVYLFGTAIYLAMVGYIGLLSAVAGGPLHSFLAMLAALTVTGVAGACFAAMQGTLTYLGAPPEYRSRVLGVLTLCIGTGPIGFFNIGWMAEAFGVSAALVISSLEGLIVLLVLWVVRSDGTAQHGAGTTRAGQAP